MYDTRLFLVLTGLSMTACGDKEDVGTVDTGSADSGTSTTDAGTDDSGTDDSGVGDSGANDTGTSDSGTADSGVGDSGTDDTGASDTGSDSGAIPAAHSAIVDAADAWLASLDTDQYDAATYAFEAEDRLDWHYLPVAAIDRNGLAFDEQSDTQVELAMALLEATLSTYGYDLTQELMEGDDYVFASGDSGAGSGWTHVAVHGTPSTTEPWGWQFQLHHVGFNVTMVGDELSQTPTLLGVSDLAETPAPDDFAPLQALTQQGWAFMETLSAAQLETVVTGSDAPVGFEAGPNWTDSLPAAAGAIVGDLDADQQTAVLEIIALYVDTMEPNHAANRMAAIESELDATTFEWQGSVTSEDVGYYRISGPSVYIECDTINTVAHIHAVWRDPDDDFGAEWLSRHYAARPHGAAPRDIVEWTPGPLRSPLALLGLSGAP